MFKKISDNAKLYIKNASWMFAEQGLKVLSGIFVGIYVARYLGPEQYGLLSYALAIVGIFMALSKLGMDSVLIRDIINHPEEKQAYISTAFALMVFAAIVGMLIVSILISYIESDQNIRLYVWIISIGLIFQTLLIVDFSFQSALLSKYSSIAKSIALMISSVLKIYLVITEAELMWFAISYAVDQALIGSLLLLFYLKRDNPSLMLGFTPTLVKPLLASAWPMVMSGIAAILLTRIDQIMIKNILGVQQLGIYSAAAKFFEGWTILAFVFSISVLPLIVKIKKQSACRYEKKLVMLFSIAFWVSAVFSIFIVIFSQEIINLTFGPAYHGASSTLSIMVCASVLSAFGFMSARYLIVEGMGKKIAMRNWIALVINIPLNLILIPLYQIEGAAIATLLSFLMVHYFLDYFDEKLRPLWKIKNNSILFPFRKKSL